MMVFSYYKVRVNLFFTIDFKLHSNFWSPFCFEKCFFKIALQKFISRSLIQIPLHEIYALFMVSAKISQTELFVSYSTWWAFGLLALHWKFTSSNFIERLLSLKRESITIVTSSIQMIAIFQFPLKYDFRVTKIWRKILSILKYVICAKKWNLTLRVHFEGCCLPP